MNFTQPICGRCYREREPGRTPVTLSPPYRGPSVRCCFCGELTGAGIRYRVDPRKVPYSFREEEKDAPPR